MRVKELKRLLESVSDDVEVVLSGHDHSFDKIYRAKLIKAEKIGKDYFESFNKTDSESVDVFWIG